MSAPITELFVKLGFKSEGLEELKAFETQLKTIANVAKEAARAVRGLSGVKIAPPVLGEAKGGLSGKTTTKVLKDGKPKALDPAVVAHLADGLQEIQDREDAMGRALDEAKALEKASDAAAAAQVKADNAATKAANDAAAAKRKQWEGIKKAGEAYKKLAAIVAVFAAAVVVAITKTLQSVMALNNFAAATGMATAKMEGLQYQMELAGGSGDDLLATLKNIQSQQAKIALGEGDLTAFSFFGVATNEDPAEVIEKVRRSVQGLRKDQLAVGREMASRMGVGDDMFAAMRAGKGGAAPMELAMTSGQLDAIKELNAAWKDFTITLGKVRDKFIAAIGPALAVLMRVMAVLMRGFVKLMNFISGDSLLAKFARILIGLGTAIVAIAAGVIGLTSAIAALSVGFAVMSAAAAPLMPIIWGIAAIVALAAGFIASLVLVLDELWETVTGGDSRLRDLGEWLLSPFIAVGEAIGDLIIMARDMWDAFKMPDWASSVFGAISGLFGGGAGSGVGSTGEAALNVPESRASAYGANETSITNDIKIDGSKSPEATAEAVSRKIKRSYSDTVHASPAASY